MTVRRHPGNGPARIFGAQARWTLTLASALLLVVLPALSLGGCAGDAEGGIESGKAVEQVSTDLRVVRGTVEPVVLMTGEIAAEDAMALAVPNVNIWPMTIRWIAEEGDEVTEGNPVVEFDNSQLASNLESLRSQVVTAGNSVSQARAQASSDRARVFFELEQKKADWQKAKLDAALPKELTSEQEWARRQLDLEKAALEKEKAERAMAATEVASKAAIEIERLALQKAQIALERAERGVAILNVIAPRTGVVQISENPQEDRPFRSGDSTWPGITVASLPDLDTLYVEASLFDVDDGQVEAGAPVRASLDAFPDEILTGTVRSVAGFAQQEGRRSSRRSFKVLVDLDGIDPSRMRPGMSVKLEVVPVIAEGLIAPRRALSFEGDTSWLHLRGEDPVAVEVGACDRRDCLISAEGTAVREGLRLAPAGSLGTTLEPET